MKPRVRFGKWSCFAATTLLCLMTGQEVRAGSSDQKDVFFTGTLIAPPACVINGTGPISVDFGSTLLAGRIDGVNYEQPLNYTLDCSGASSNALRLSIVGPKASFNPALIDTGKANLGIAIRVDGVLLPVEAWRNFTYPSQPVLTAVPVKDPGSSLAGGTFTATAILLTAYQ
ncbi:fimbrial protein [Aeromonas hydrophila]|uniref:fimbrial protein n=1 Tax=Aeromonas hydrophila TaxID=644 RepID=UPI000955F80A|nr:fimbrial protein [Aeromonas hydrophila]SIR20483.1 Pilin (type 1 fimbria component protein) [Aeromonas hydrophila]SIR36890.1 Pilin (type 1 fimbria component protein) [Aeromonas hydrophila]